ncbi:phytanoyl-CoA dioxygenase family protein [Nocardia arthritidis]|uniref:Ether brdige forming dioxygenase n=1 Tax=Nocardia arthritidis TaxID=228602 RepID=A0A6C0R4C9_9NOCA|nr:ether brdige forming dioxygenase [Nocardia arthritidis]QIS10436.1 phytanoyl-CoA dioxygenase family protein [Nocardia arthritidis]
MPRNDGRIDVTRSDVVDQRYVTQFREDGFTHIPNVLTPEEVAHYREAALEAIEREGMVAGMGMKVGRTAVRTTKDAFRNNPALRALARHPRVGAIAEQLSGLSLRVWGGETLVKSPGDELPTMWHDDLTLAPLEGRILLNAWIALVDVPVERGCMTFIPGSHRRPEPFRAPLAAAQENPDSYLFDTYPQLAWERRVTVPLRAGDATFHQWRTGHTAGGNTSDGDRVAFITTYTDAESTYRPHPGHQWADLEAGQLPPDDIYPRVAEFA